MLDSIIKYSIQNKMVVGLLTIALIIWGGYSLTKLPIDAVPDITNNQVQVLTIAGSQSAMDIERLVTFPVEQTMATIPGITEMRSFSRFGLSVVTIVFNDDVDIYWARQQVNERLVQAASMIPPGVGKPEMGPVTTGLGEIFQYIIKPKKGYEAKYTAMELRTTQDWIVRRQLLGTPGVADVASFGGYLKQYEIAIDPDKLRSYNLSIPDVFAALEANNQNTGGAYIDRKPNAYFIRSEGLINSVDDISKIIVKPATNKIPILIRDIAEVRFGFANRYGAMTYNNQSEVVGAVVMMLKGENSSAVVNRVKTRIANIEKTLPEGLTIQPFLDRSSLVTRAISTVEKNLIEGALIVIAVLVLFLGNLRAGLIVASVIPLAMLFAVALMHTFGVSGNLMSLGAIDFGLIVDGAVIIVEATMHHLGMRGIVSRLTQSEMDEEVYTSASKIRTSAAFGEIIILIVYLPILALVGIEGKMFRPMAQTVGFAILGAFLLSLTYVPMISALLLSKKSHHEKNFSDRMMDFFQRGYAPIIRKALQLRFVIVSSAIIIFAVSVFLFMRMGGEFLPTLDEGDFAVETRTLAGSSISYTIDAAMKSAEILKAKFPDEVKEVVGKIGTSEIPTDPMPLEACDLIVMLKPRKEWKKADDREALAEQMGEALKDVPGVTYGFQQPIQMRFNELMTGVRQDIAIKIYGEDLDVLADLSKQVAKIVNTVEGSRDIYVEEITGLPQIVIKLNRDEIAKYNLSIAHINQTINAAFAGESAGLVYEGEKRFDLVVRLDAQNRQRVEDVRNLFVTAPDGNQVPLSQLAEVNIEIGPNQIQREDAKRRIIVGFNVRGRDIANVVKELQEKVSNQIKFPSGYYPTYGGQFENLQEAQARLSIAVPAALALIFILLFLTFNSFKQSLLIFTAIPMAAIGGVFALLLRGMPFSISAGVGFIALFGVAVLNGIVLIAEFNRLKHEGMTDLKEIILQGTAIRLRPVLMTASVASLGFLPMALATSAGAEVQRPLATVVIGGLVTSTILTLVVLPCLYMYFENFKAMKASPKAMMITLVIALSSVTGFAQTIKKVTLDEAIDLTLKNNKSVAAAAIDVDYAKQLKRTSTDIGKTSVMLMHGQYNTYAKDNNLTITQTIPFPTVFTSQQALGRSLVLSSELNKAATEHELVYQVKQVYYQLMFLQARHKLLSAQDSIYGSFVKAATLRYKTGETRLLEKATAETQQNETRNLLAMSAADIKVAENLLMTLTGSDAPLMISADSLQTRELPFPLDTFSVEQNPHLRYLKQQTVVNEKEMKVFRAKVLPELSFGYFNQTLIGTLNSANEPATRSTRFSGIMAGVAIPLWIVPQAARARAASLNYEKSQKTYEYNQSLVQGQWQRSIQEYFKNKGSVDYYRSSAIQNAELILKQSDIAYRSGEIAYTEYWLAIKNAIQIKENYINNINNLNQSIINLEFLAGSK